MSIGDHVDAIEGAGAKGRHKDDGRAIGMVHSFANEAGGVFVFGQVKGDPGGL